MVPRAQCPHLVFLTLLRLVGHFAGLGVQHLAALLDAIEVGLVAPAALDRPLRAAREHRIHLLGIQPDRAGAADARRDVLEQRVGERALHRLDICPGEPGVQAAHAARNVEAHTAGRHHAAALGVKGGDTTDGKAVTPVSIGHRIRRTDDARQRGDVDRLL